MLKISGCGDILIADRLPEGKYKGFEEIKNFLGSHDVRFGNLETTIHRNEGYPSLFPGGGYSMADPDVLDDIREYGFNLLSIANNHMLDYSHKGLEATLKYLKEKKFAFAGAGMNLAEASAPCYIETSNGRAALIAVTSSFHDSDAAGNQSVDMCGRPGVNPLRHTEVLQITPDLLEAVQRIAVGTGINEYRDYGAKNGYVLQNKNVKLRDVRFTEGDEIKKLSNVLEKDLDRVKKRIKEAESQADCVIVSVHGHQLKGTDNYADDFIVEFCQAVADAGANIVFCHGAHVIRGIEKRNDSMIFYGLGDFVLKNELERKLPADFYEKYSIPYDCYGSVGLAMDIRSNGQTRGLCATKGAWESFIPSIEFDTEKKKVNSVKLYPITLHFELPRSRRGWPELSYNKEILDELEKISSDYDIHISSDEENGCGVVL
ncbi:CapA family protein [Ruminococcus sp.]|uniref:CapA family protein n=1 Tax=Ruminococcus sp. TaxID=41978 RepID=UPI0025E53199|nr:CapA family protein [Ruminococcus sp.]